MKNFMHNILFWRETPMIPSVVLSSGKFKPGISSWHCPVYVDQASQLTILDVCLITKRKGIFCPRQRYSIGYILYMIYTKYRRGMIQNPSYYLTGTLSFLVHHAHFPSTTSSFLLIALLYQNESFKWKPYIPLEFRSKRLRYCNKNNHEPVT